MTKHRDEGLHPGEGAADAAGGGLEPAGGILARPSPPPSRLHAHTSI